MQKTFKIIGLKKIGVNRWMGGQNEGLEEGGMLKGLQGTV